MGHRRHRRHRGGCGCGHRKCGGDCGFNGGFLQGAPGFGPRFARFGQDEPLMPTSMMAAPVAAPVQLATPAQLLAVSQPQAMSFNQALMGQYIAARNAAGFPVAPIVGPLGFKPKKVRKGSTRVIVARPESFYSPKAIFIPCDVAKHFDICEIRVGQIALVSGIDPVPAEMYTNQGVGPAVIQLPPMIPGQHVYMTVRNHGHSSHWFRAALNGIELA